MIYKNSPNTKEDFDKNYEIQDGHWMWIGSKYPFGHGVYRYRGCRYAHRASWMIYKGDIPKGLCVLHKCDIPDCVNPDHLFLGTRAENNADRDAKGRQRSVRGKDNPNAKLSKEVVERVRELSGFISSREAAALLGVSASTIKNCRKGDSWAWV